MIFVGDIALSFDGVIDYSEVSAKFTNKNCFGNLEGSLVTDDKGLLEKRVVFNSLPAIQKLITDFSFCGFSLANNHIADLLPAERTTSVLDDLGVEHAGAGANISEASKPFGFVEAEVEIRVLCFGWSAIQCIPAGVSQGGIAPYEVSHVRKVVDEVLRKNPEMKIVCFFHWNYELEKYPHPHDRSLAHELIDNGVSAIIGCHSHRIQPIEIYKGRPIVYGLGNFLFPQGLFFDGKVCYPSFCNDQYAFEIDFESDRYNVHKLKYDYATQKVNYVSMEQLTDSNIQYYCDFAHLSHVEYEKYFKHRRFQRKFLPIFKISDSRFMYKCKLYFIVARDLVIKMLMILRLKN